MNFYEKTVNSKMIFNGQVLNLRIDDVELPDGNTSRREIVEHGGGVGIIAIKDGKVVLVRQFRKPLEKTIIEIPAGKLEKGEDPFNCALRELEEEAGLVALDLNPLTTIYPSPGYSSERLSLFTACSFKEGAVHRDKDEFLDVEYISMPDVLKMIGDGTIKDAKTICGILMYNTMR